MIVSQQHADAWQATAHRRIAQIQVAIIDLIDLDPDQPVTPRKPTAKERESQDRHDGWFHPTPQGPSRRTGRSDPTGRAVERWETAIERATTDLYELVGETTSIVESLGLVPLAEDGRRSQPPVAPELDPDAVRPRVMVAPGAARETVTVACAWLGAAVDALSSRMAGMEGDEAEAMAGRTAYLDRLMGQVARRHTTDVRTCENGCGRNIDRGKVCQPCIQRAHRARKAS